ncbi:uncharacterized protein LODBEIA_P56890 [Lodderomyces beijingensis]|uniref:ATPase expression protein 1 n=1 Tax=Lodderomyces beijingensis TaxID=1775926 RepID=A0ABP0ZQZ5_9ASCO
MRWLHPSVWFVCSRCLSSARSRQASLSDAIASYIAATVSAQDVISPIQPYIRHLPGLTKQLQLCLDPQNKAAAILASPVHLLHPQVYLYTEPLCTDAHSRGVLLQRLLFHRCYPQCWDLFVRGSLSDVDELLSAVARMSNRCAAVDFALAMPDGYENRSFGVQVSKAVGYTLGVDPGRLKSAWRELQRVATAEEVLARAPQDPPLLGLKRAMQVARDDETAAVLAHFEDVLRAPGWVTSVCPSFDHSTTLRESPAPESLRGALASVLRPPVALADVDVVYLMNVGVDPLAVLRVYQKSPALVNKLVERVLEGSDEDVREAYILAAPRLTPGVASKCLSRVAPGSSIVPLLRAVPDINVVEVLEALELDSKQYMELIRHYHRHPRVSRFLITNFCKSGRVEERHLVSLASTPNAARGFLLELHRSALCRAHLLSPTLLLNIVNALLQSLSPGVSLKQSLRAMATTQRSLLHNSFRSFAQAVSVLEPRSLARAHNLIFQVLHSPQFFLAADPQAAAYLYKAIAYDVFRFVARKENRLAVFAEILPHVEPAYWARHWHLYSVVASDVAAAGMLLQQHCGRKMELRGQFPAIVRAILHHRELPIDKRIAHLDAFLATAEHLDYPFTLKAKSCHEILAELQRGGGHTSVQWVARLAKRNRHMRRALQQVRERTQRSL